MMKEKNWLLPIPQPSAAEKSDTFGRAQGESGDKEPTYSYNPDINFQQGENTEPLEIPAGPNRAHWIGLD